MKNSFFGIIGKSKAITDVIDIIKKVASSNVNVLITGETGTGKELVAQAIHASSQRQDNPFITVNCSALPDTLLESELFGYERGAFTGAFSRKIGKFEQANNGTLFLDEIGDMSIQAQAKILRVTEENNIDLLGGTKAVKVNRRIIAATSKDINKEIKNGSFRVDLFHRLDEIQIHLPTLKERKEDIPLLANHFLKMFCKELNIPSKRISDSSVALLKKYNWVGNVRELKNAVKKAVLLTEGDTIWIEQIPLDFNIGGYLSDNWGPFQKKLVSIHELERAYIIHALKTLDYNKKRTAEVLKIDRTSLYNKIKRYKIKIDPN